MVPARLMAIELPIVSVYGAVNRHDYVGAMRPRRQAIMALLALAPLAPLGAQRVDTSAVKRTILTLDSVRSVDLSHRGIQALFGVAAPNRSLGFPGLPIVRTSDAAQRIIGPKYAGARIELTSQHALVSSDGQFACAIGVTRVRLAGDADGPQRNGRYASCWQRTANGDGWQLLVHAQNGEAPDLPVPKAILEGAPHSATMPGSRSDVKDAVAADEAFAHLAADSGAASAFARFAAQDAMLLGGRAIPRRGPTEIGAAFEGSRAKFGWKPLAESSAGSGGLAFTVGEAVINLDGVISGTKYLTIWRRESDGRWKYVFDLGSDRP
jgi:ketosteroid isomerase-like protein